MDAQKVLVSCSVVTLTTIAVVWWYRKSKKEQTPSQWKAVGTVSDLYMYPLKSGRRMELTEMECTNYGPIQMADKTVYRLRDRFLIVYDDTKMEFKTGRAHPNMVLIEVSNHDTDHVALDAPNMRTLYVQIPEVLKENARLCKLHGKEQTEIVDCGDEAASWVSRYILEKDSGLRLGFHNETLKDRKIGSEFTKFYPNIRNDDMGIFSDLTSFMLINKTSVNELNSRLENEISLCQFRGNIVVDNVDEPYVEDKWQWIKIGETIFRNIKPCTRCIFTTIDENGVMDRKNEPLVTLRTYRQLSDEEERKASNFTPVMGIHLGVRQTGIIRVDDIVYVA